MADATEQASPAQPAMDYRRRQEVFAERLRRKGLDAYLLVEAANVRYLSGFTGEDSTLLATPRRTLLLTDSRYVEQAEGEARVDEVVSRHTRMARAVAGTCRGLGIRTLGITAANVSQAMFAALAKADTALEPRAACSGIVEKMRRRKDEAEVAAVRASLRKAEEAFGRLMGHVRAGRSERWLAARLEFEMRALGAESASFDVICAAGARASVPHARPGSAKLEVDSAILLDWGARLAGYCSDLTRVIALGTIPTALEALADVVLEAQEAVFAKLKPGNTCAEIDAAGRAVLARSGYGRCFGHSIGHGVGLAVHEQPRLGPREDTVLLPGMVVTIEPGIYLPGRVGVRIEEMALITEGGHEVLTELPREPRRPEVGA